MRRSVRMAKNRRSRKICGERGVLRDGRRSLSRATPQVTNILPLKTAARRDPAFRLRRFLAMRGPIRAAQRGRLPYATGLRTVSTRGRPARSGTTRASSKPAARARAAASSRRVSCSSKAAPPPGLSARAHHGSKRRSTSRPSSPPSSASAGSKSAHLARNLGEHGGGHVRRVRHDEVEPAHRARGNALAQVALHHPHAVGQAESVDVLARKRHRLRRDVGGDDARARMLVGDRARDAAGSRAQVGHEQRRGNGRGIVRRGRGGAGPGGVRKRGRRFGGGLIDLGCILRGAGREQLFGFGLGHARVERARPARCGQKGERLAHQHLGLGTGDEHAGAHLHRDMAKRHLAGDVLQRLAPAPPRHVVAQRVALLERQRPLQSGVQLDPAKPARPRRSAILPTGAGSRRPCAQGSPPSTQGRP